MEMALLPVYYTCCILNALLSHANNTFLAYVCTLITRLIHIQHFMEKQITSALDNGTGGLFFCNITATLYTMLLQCSAMQADVRLPLCISYDINF